MGVRILCWLSAREPEASWWPHRLDASAVGLDRALFKVMVQTQTSSPFGPQGVHAVQAAPAVGVDHDQPFDLLHVHIAGVWVANSSLWIDRKA